MRKSIFPLAIVIIMAAGCKNSKQREFTLLGEGTPYSNSPEVLDGKVKSVIEKSYWAVPEGDAFIKGNPFTKADRDSVGGWTDDFEAVFDAEGDVTVCTGLNESGKSIWKNENVKENKLIAKRNFYRNDTLRFYDQFKYGTNGFYTKASRLRAGVDTVMMKADFKTNGVGYPTEVQLFNSKGDSIELLTYAYDEQNRFINFKILDKGGKPSFQYEVKYNDKNKVSELNLRDKENKITAANYMTYECDKKGNWIKAIVKDLKNRVVIEERSYTYFE